MVDQIKTFLGQLFFDLLLVLLLLLLFNKYKFQFNAIIRNELLEEGGPPLYRAARP